ncbi:MAG: site-2 protease family protein [Ruminococcaceae bacterium]|nr:site-2 protease family protein [Oscillospiraceae bacterium]
MFSIEEILVTLLSIPGAVLAFSIKGWAKAFAADKLGDPTPRNMGKLTMNPLAHIDFLGLVFIVLFGFGWTKPTPVNTRYFKNIRRDNAIFILSGPVACIFAGFCAIGLAALFSKFIFINDVMLYIYYIFDSAASLCISLAAFYMLPLPGLDGYELIANFLPYQWYRKLYYIERYSMYIFIGFILLINVTNLGAIIFWPADQLMSIFWNFWSLVF